MADQELLGPKDKRVIEAAKDHRANPDLLDPLVLHIQRATG